MYNNLEVRISPLIMEKLDPSLNLQTGWRISLLSKPGKVMATKLLNRMRTAVDRTLRPNQAGFAPGPSCCVQIFSLTPIIDKCLAWQTPVLLNFIDFKKALDFIHRKTLWKIVAKYGISNKIINIMKSFYQGSCCAVRMEVVLGEFNEIHSGRVRQGCLLSPLLFSIIMDWILKRSMVTHTCIKLVDGKELSDLNFTDDIVLFHDSWAGMRP